MYVLVPSSKISAGYNVFSNFPCFLTLYFRFSFLRHRRRLSFPYRCHRIAFLLLLFHGRGRAIIFGKLRPGKRTPRSAYSWMSRIRDTGGTVRWLVLMIIFVEIPFCQRLDIDMGCRADGSLVDKPALGIAGAKIGDGFTGL